ncbi:hypothetical protein BG846_02961 [Streptomyces fradiae ATCC 10745 = DSM 40063]|uniref:Uncharacterized protein n=1 Tax=Streptomyces fradiae ATCC 10745 = DSM 40063 TaxID=1319510 RepID=A0A1Y2NVY7_STRFR|nr:hypothetical protein BG846_02961 [Streptomyces fradiae ATCC 10745 = DSM 40063]
MPAGRARRRAGPPRRAARCAAGCPAMGRPGTRWAAPGCSGARCPGARCPGVRCPGVRCLGARGRPAARESRAGQGRPGRRRARRAAWGCPTGRGRPPPTAGRPPMPPPRSRRSPCRAARRGRPAVRGTPGCRPAGSPPRTRPPHGAGRTAAGAPRGPGARAGGGPRGPATGRRARCREGAREGVGRSSCAPSSRAGAYRTGSVASVHASGLPRAPGCVPSGARRASNGSSGPTSPRPRDAARWGGRPSRHAEPSVPPGFGEPPGFPGGPRAGSLRSTGCGGASTGPRRRGAGCRRAARGRGRRGGEAAPARARHGDGGPRRAPPLGRAGARPGPVRPAARRRSEVFARARLAAAGPRRRDRPRPVRGGPLRCAARVGRGGAVAAAPADVPGGGLVPRGLGGGPGRRARPVPRAADWSAGRRA